MTMMVSTVEKRFGIGKNDPEEVYTICVDGNHYISRLKFESILFLAGLDMMRMPRPDARGRVHMLTRDQYMKVIAGAEAKSDYWTVYRANGHVAEIGIGPNKDTAEQLVYSIAGCIEEVTEAKKELKEKESN